MRFSPSLILPILSDFPGIGCSSCCVLTRISPGPNCQRELAGARTIAIPTGPICRAKSPNFAIFAVRPARYFRSGGTREPMRRLDDDDSGQLWRTSVRLLAAVVASKAYLRIARRTAAAGISTKLGNHSFRATDITAYLKNSGTWKKRRRWPASRRCGRRSSMTGGWTTSPWMRSSG